MISETFHLYNNNYYCNCYLLNCRLFSNKHSIIQLTHLIDLCLISIINQFQHLNGSIAMIVRSVNEQN